MYIGKKEAEMYYQAYNTRIEISIQCPYCEKQTRLIRTYEPVEVEKKTMFECEHCKKSFYALISIQTKDIIFAPRGVKWLSKNEGKEVN